MKLLLLILFFSITTPSFAATQKERVQILFTEDTPYGEYTDALYFTPEEFTSKSQGDIDALKQTRVANYVNVVQNSPAPAEPTKEELQAEIVVLQEQIAERQTKIDTMKVNVEVIQ